MKKIVIVGAGTAGITLSLRLLQKTKNCEIVLLDAGPSVDHGNRRKWLDFVARGPSFDPYEDLKDPKNEQEYNGEEVLTLSGSRYFAVGGSTNVWGGWCVRFQPEDFHLNSNTGECLDWPYSYDTLEPYYQRAEETLWVAGKGKPNPAIPYTLKDGVIIEALEKLDINNYEPLPLARREDCVTIGTCKYCPIRKRYIPQDDLDFINENYGERFTLISSTIATAINMKSKNLCGGVNTYNPVTCEQGELTADIVVVASGAVESPKLLLSSKSKEWPDGVGNKFGHVGKHITAHPLVRVIGQRRENPDHLEQPVDFPTLACRHYDSKTEQGTGKLFFVRDGRKNYTSIETELLKGKSIPQIRNTVRDTLKFELRGFIEIFSHEQNWIDLGSGKSSFGGPNTKIRFTKTPKTLEAISLAQERLTRILEAANCTGIEPATYDTLRADHATSTCRMSKTEEGGVVDENLTVHGTKNLFICSNAAMPNGSAVNPTLTLVALTEKLADFLQETQCI